MGGAVEVLGGERVPDGVLGQAVAAYQSLARGAARDLVGVLGEQAGAQDVGEQVVVAEPGALGVERHDEQVVALEVLQHRAAVGLAGDRVAQGTGEPVEDGGAEQELAHLGGLPGQHLVGEVVDDEPVAAGERLDEAATSAASGMPRSESAASCSPATQPSVRSSSASTSAR